MEKLKQQTQKEINRQFNFLKFEYATAPAEQKFEIKKEFDKMAAAVKLLYGEWFDIHDPCFQLDISCDEGAGNFRESQRTIGLI